MYVCVHMCACVYVREIDRERERESERCVPISACTGVCRCTACVCWICLPVNDLAHVYACMCTRVCPYVYVCMVDVDLSSQ